MTIVKHSRSGCPRFCTTCSYMLALALYALIAHAAILALYASMAANVCAPLHAAISTSVCALAFLSSALCALIAGVANAVERSSDTP